MKNVWYPHFPSFFIPMLSVSVYLYRSVYPYSYFPVNRSYVWLLTNKETCQFIRHISVSVKAIYTKKIRHYNLHYNILKSGPVIVAIIDYTI